ncbi:MAG: Cyclic di-AMP synthase CdaA [Chlamydiae bacterium]|nr:Cyclic di-AMP synthase CdaA [Chlamydiota bacterium]
MDTAYIYIPIIEILIMTVALNWLFSFFWNTRTMDLLLGFVVFLVFLGVVSWLNLPVLKKIMSHIANVAVMAVIIIFQPELRLAISKLSVKGRKGRIITDLDKFLDHLAHSIYRMSEKRVGALILLENQDSLEEFARRSVLLNAQFSSELLESLFVTTTPLHDGAVIIRNNMIVSAATILPLAEESSQLTRSMGTRHRAGLGLSQITDSLVILVSEETGKVSIARDGIMTRGVKIDRFKGIIRSVFNPTKVSIQTRFNPLKWIAK